MRFDFFAPLSTTAVVATDKALALGAGVHRAGLTLRAKGIVACVALLIYALAVGAHVTFERGKLQQVFQEMDVIHDKHGLLLRVNSGLIHLILSLQDILDSENTPQYGSIELDLASFATNLPALKDAFPATAKTVEYFERQSVVLSQGRSREALIVLRDKTKELAAELEQIADDVEKRHAMLSREYGDLNRYITLYVMMGANLAGIAAFGVVVTLFLSRLGRDAKRLETRAMAIVDGYRGPPLEVLRRDEVGMLMEALNRMQSQLRQREQQQEISRQQRFHQEKMAAIGSIAATVAHEVSNPLNSISGIAQYTIEALQSHQRLDYDTLRRNVDLIFKQTERIGLIIRRLADLTDPCSSDLQPININELVKNTCSFIRYDRRLRHIDLISNLDPDVPAVRAVADHLTQILMNLLINSGDALEGMADRDQRTIRVSTRRSDDEVILSVSDNGHGMGPMVLSHAFENSFTTKPTGKGRGIGLYLCKALIEEIGGRIELESTLGVGTTARVCLPLRSDKATAV